jgi:hypothetical protein
MAVFSMNFVILRFVFLNEVYFFFTIRQNHDNGTVEGFEGSYLGLEGVSLTTIVKKNVSKN